MADEAVIIELAGQPKGMPINFTCASGTAIAKGTILKLTDPNTVAASTASTDRFAGIAATEKSATDYSTTIGVWTCGKFDLKCSGAVINAGDYVITSGANLIGPCSSWDTDSGAIIGKAGESAAAGTAETIAVYVGIY